MKRTNDPTDPLLISLAARAGQIQKHDLAYWHCLLYHNENRRLPDGGNVALGVKERFGKKISRSSAYLGRKMAADTLAFAEDSRAAAPEGNNVEENNAEENNVPKTGTLSFHSSGQTDRLAA